MPRRRTWFVVVAQSHFRAGLLIAFCLTLFLGAQEEKKLSVYTPQSSFSVVVRDREGREYVSLFDVIQPMGTAKWKIEGDKWRLGFGGEESQLQAGKTKAKIRGKNIDMGAPALLENDVLLVPIDR